MGGVLGEFLDFHMVFLEEMSEACISAGQEVFESNGDICVGIV
jgi:hypothetical protein